MTPTIPGPIDPKDLKPGDVFKVRREDHGDVVTIEAVVGGLNSVGLRSSSGRQFRWNDADWTFELLHRPDPEPSPEAMRLARAVFEDGGRRPRSVAATARRIDPVLQDILREKEKA